MHVLRNYLLYTFNDRIKNTAKEIPLIIVACYSLSLSLCTVPSEHAVIAKERRSGMYHLSAYYLAKSVSELPLVLLQPIFYLVITYWIVGLNGAAGFFGTLFIVITNALVAQVYIIIIHTTVTCSIAPLF